MKNEDKEELERLVRSLLQDDEFLVSLSISGADDIVLQVDSFTSLPIHRLGELSRMINGELEKADLDYSLEVSSPGVGIPFRCLEQYYKHKGSPVYVVLFTGQRYDGLLSDVTHDGISLSFEKEIPAYIDENGKKHKKTKVEEIVSFLYDEIKETCYRF